MKHLILALLLALFATSCVKYPEPVPTTRKVVLVHGFLEDGKSLNYMRTRLERKGAACYIPILKPQDAHCGIEPLAHQLKHDIEREFGPNEPISIVAFSMGGIVTRYYLQELGGAKRCENLFTISSPHHGTLTAWGYPGRGTAQMRPNSPFIQHLNATEDRLGDMPIVSYRTPLDLIILPSKSSVWPRATNITHPSLLHPFMVTSPFIIKDIEQRLFKQN